MQRHDRRGSLLGAAAATAALGGLFAWITWAEPPHRVVYGGIEQARAAAVIVRPLEGAGHGSGVVVGRNFILTAAHVVSDTEKVSIEFGDATKAHARVIWRGTISEPGTGTDLAVLYLEDPAPVRRAAMTCRDPRRGEEVEAVGAPDLVARNLKTWNVSTWGRVSGPIAENAAVWLADIDVSPGNSGGPVLSSEGHVLGLVSFLMAHVGGVFGGLSGPSGLSAFVHLGAACERLRALGVLGEARS